MVGRVTRKISAASARAHTRKSNNNASFKLPPGMLKKILAALFVGILAWIYQEVTEELGVYIVSFDRPGYGESDPNSKRTVKSMALDIEELAYQLGLGFKFYFS
ncbi:hypothetical protein COLO4_29762 [Corchorus olitorius]|uniref:Uncharacterized protein n=1 Tax=Corchorus olitorius TaxID=93759 RepID=A0A1R3HDB4_9ROSI|nr:hypothetical protein COLO4_29762 [Corchorus olitorius]